MMFSPDPTKKAPDHGVRNPGSPPAGAVAAGGGFKISGLRWYIVGMLCLATGLNYLDRQALSVLAHTIKEDLNITNLQYSQITSTFLFSYMIMYAVSGRVVDWLGTRRSFIIFVSGWSAASMLHALARTALHFSFFRFLLGATEPANFPAGVKAVTEWFPVRERALAVGIFNSGTAIGAAAAAPLVSWCALQWGWRSAFVVGGLLGGVWVLVWTLVYRVPRRHPMLSAKELNLIEGDGKVEESKLGPVPVSRILGMRETWGCILARMLTDPITYFFIFWTPMFLQQERGFSLAEIGRYSWIPFVALGAGNIVGGLAPRLMLGFGWSLNRSRKTVMGLASVIIAICCWRITAAASSVWAITLISIAMFCHAAWANMTLPAEVFPKHVVGTVSGFAGAMGALIGAISQQAIGRTVDGRSFGPVFMVTAFLPLTAFIIVCALIKDLGCVREVPSGAAPALRPSDDTGGAASKESATSFEKE